MYIAASTASWIATKGTTPISSRMGAVIGTRMRAISKVSGKKPSTNIIAMTTIGAPSSPPGIAGRRRCASVSPPMRVKTSAKAVAPSSMMNTMEEMDSVPPDVALLQPGEVRFRRMAQTDRREAGEHRAKGKPRTARPSPFSCLPGYPNLHERADLVPFAGKWIMGCQKAICRVKKGARAAWPGTALGQCLSYSLATVRLYP